MLLLLRVIWVQSSGMDVWRLLLLQLWDAVSRLLRAWPWWLWLLPWVAMRQLCCSSLPGTPT